MINHAPARRSRVLKAIAVLIVVIAISPIAIVRLLASMSQDRR